MIRYIILEFNKRQTNFPLVFVKMLLNVAPSDCEETNLLSSILLGFDEWDRNAFVFKLQKYHNNNFAKYYIARLKEYIPMIFHLAREQFQPARLHMYCMTNNRSFLKNNPEPDAHYYLNLINNWSMEEAVNVGSIRALKYVSNDKFIAYTLGINLDWGFEPSYSIGRELDDVCFDCWSDGHDINFKESHRTYVQVTMNARRAALYIMLAFKEFLVGDICRFIARMVYETRELYVEEWIK